ncbi:FMN-binding protein [Lactobacillus sp. W8092]|nr:FMN-binding protein [Lactobacillus sp. W8092]
MLQQSESEDYGQKALSELPAQMIVANTYQVDNISGASSSSRAPKEAVKNALDKIP